MGSSAAMLQHEGHEEYEEHEEDKKSRGMDFFVAFDVFVGFVVESGR
jgi:hypothetical protein